MVWQHQHSFQGCTTSSSFESSKRKLKSYFKNIALSILKSKFHFACESSQQNRKAKLPSHLTSQKCVTTGLNKLLSSSTNAFQRCCNREFQLKELSSLHKDRQFKIFDNQSISSFLEKPLRQHRNRSNFPTLAKNLKYIVFFIMILVGSTFSMALQHVNRKEPLKSLKNLENLHQDIHLTTKPCYKNQPQNQPQVYTNKKFFFISRPKLFLKTDLKPLHENNVNFRQNRQKNSNLMQKLSQKAPNGYKNIVRKFRTTPKRLHYLKALERLICTTSIFRPFGIRQKRVNSRKKENKIYMKMFIGNLKKKIFFNKNDNVQLSKKYKYLNGSENSTVSTTPPLTQVNC